MNSLISGLAIDPDTKVTCNPYYSLGRYDTVLHSRHIYQGGEAIPFGTFRLLVLKEEESDQIHTRTEFRDIQTMGYPQFSTTVAIDMNYDPNRLSEKIKSRILRTIHSIEFLPCISEWVQENTRFVNPDTTLGITVRTWKAAHERDINRPYSFDVYRSAIEKALTSEITDVILSVDNPDYNKEYITLLSKFPVSIHVLHKSPEQNETQYAFVKMLTLSKCAKVIGSRMSTFTELIFWFGDCKPKMIPVL
jgi:hypothetical protein